MIRPDPQLRSIVDRDGALILNISTSEATPLNSTGAYVWQRLEQGMLIESIIADLARDTNTDVAVVASDVDRFMEQLKCRHLLTL